MKSLVEIFNKTLMEDGSYKKDKKYVPSFKIKPSMLGSPCLRKIYYSSAGVPEDYGFDLEGKKRMKLGEAVHVMLEDVFKKAGIWVAYKNPDGSVHKKFGFADETEEFPLQCEDLFVKNAYTDAVLIIDGELWLGEFKSINSKGFSTLQQAKTDHMIQAVLYWYVFNLLLQEGKFSHIPELQNFTKAKGIRWLYVNKDDTQIREFTMTEGDAFFSSIVSKIVSIKQFYDTKTLPPKTEDWCRSCNWRDKCKKNFNID